MNEEQIFELLLNRVEEVEKDYKLSTPNAAMTVVYKELSALVAAVGGLSQMVATQAKKIEELEDEIKVTREYTEHEIDDLRFNAGL